MRGSEKRNLSKHKLALRKLVCKQYPLPGKKQLIVKTGGFLLLLRAAVVPTLAIFIEPSKTIHVTQDIPRPGRGLPPLASSC